jgi:hypothetical protein
MRTATRMSAFWQFAVLWGECDAARRTKMAELMIKEAAVVLVAIVDLAVAATLVAIVLLAVRSYVRKRSHS